MSTLTRFRLALLGAVAALTLACGEQSPSPANTSEEGTENAKSAELKRVMDRMMMPPKIRTEPGFAARLLIAPGESPLYDPLIMRDHGSMVWVADDGGLDGDRAGQILAIDHQGKVSDVLPLGRLTWVHSFDIAPASFGPYAGHIYMESALEAGLEAQFKSHVVRRIDLRSQREPEMVCTLPPAGGADGKGSPFGGGDSLFGPEGSPFAGKFFTVTSANRAVYQVTPDGRCTPFVILDLKKNWGVPWGLAFTPDGQHLLVSMLHFAGDGEATIVRVRPDGTAEPEPLVRVGPKKLRTVFGMAYAPASFGEYAGQLFVAANDAKWNLQYKGKFRTDTLPETGEVYRLTSDGELKLVASGFRGAVGVHFVSDRLWVTDINGDFLLGARELPDGFVVEITLDQGNE